MAETFLFTSPLVRWLKMLPGQFLAEVDEFAGVVVGREGGEGLGSLLGRDIAVRIYVGDGRARWAAFALIGSFSPLKFKLLFFHRE